MRIDPFRIELPALGKIIEISEESCRCGSCETMIVKLIDDDDPSDLIEYNTKTEGCWFPPGCNEEPENLRDMAHVIFELAKMVRKR